MHMLLADAEVLPVYTVREVLAGRWWIAVLALLVALTATPVVRWIAYSSRIVDRPDDLLKPHGRPVAYLGGVAICVGLLAGLGGYISVMPRLAEHWACLTGSLRSWHVGTLLADPLMNVIGIALGSLVIMIVGLLDDLYDLSPRQKIFGQIAAAGILFSCGVGSRMAMVVFSQFAPHVFPPVVTITSVVMCMGLVIATCNATNLIDGLDGLCGGVTGIIALGFLGLAVYLAIWGRKPGADELRIALCLAMAGAVLGFLPYNIPPASIFMGDAGSMLLGFFVATMMILFCEESNARWFAAACVVFAVPIMDTSLAVVRRLLSGRPIFSGDRSHLYDQLVDRGMSVKRVVALFYILAAIAAAFGVGTAVLLRIPYSFPLYGVIFVAIWVVFYCMGMLRPMPREPRSP